jgi:hypothetical protein
MRNLLLAIKTEKENNELDARCYETDVASIAVRHVSTFVVLAGGGYIYGRHKLLLFQKEFEFDFSKELFLKHDPWGIG